MSSRASEKRTEEVRALKRKDENKICVNCKERGPEAVCTTFNTFVCMMCAGIHREYNHRIKNISTSEFTDEEVSGLKEGGNAVAKQIYFYSYKESDFVVPDVNEPRVIREKKVRDFIKLAYVDKKWMKKEEQPKKSKKKAKKESEDEEESEAEETPKKKKSEKKKSKKKEKAESDDDDESDEDSDEDEKKKAKKSSKKPTKRDPSPPPPLKPLTDVLPNIGKLVVREKTDADGESTKKSKKKTEKKITKPETNGQSSTPAPNLLDLSNVLGGTHNNPPSNDWADFGGSSSTTAVAAPAKSHSAADDWANFGSTPFPSSSPPAAAPQPKPASNGLDDLFANNQSASAVYANFGFPTAAAAAPAPAAQQTHAINFTVQSANAPKHQEVQKEEHTNDPFADLLGTSHSEHSAPPALGPTPSPPTTAAFGMPNLAPINTPAMPSPPAIQTINPAMGGMQPSVNPAMNAMVQQMMMPAMMGGQPGTNMTPAQMQQYFQQQMMMQQMMMQQMMMQGMRGMGAPAQPANAAAPVPNAAAPSASHNGPAPGSGASIPNFTGIGAPSAQSGRPAASGANNAFAGFF